MVRTRIALLLAGAAAVAGLLVGAAGTLKANDGPTATPAAIPQQCLEFMQSWGWTGGGPGPGMMGGQYPSGMGPGMMGGSSSSMFDWMREHGTWTSPEADR
jgi:hypothetical protein